MYTPAQLVTVAKVPYAHAALLNAQRNTHELETRHNVWNFIALQCAKLDLGYGIHNVRFLIRPTTLFRKYQNR